MVAINIHLQQSTAMWLAAIIEMAILIDITGAMSYAGFQCANIVVLTLTYGLLIRWLLRFKARKPFLCAVAASAFVPALVPIIILGIIGPGHGRGITIESVWLLLQGYLLLTLVISAFRIFIGVIYAAADIWERKRGRPGK